MVRWMLQSAFVLALCPFMVAQQGTQQPGKTPVALEPSLTAPAAGAAVPNVLKIPKNTEIHLVALETVSSATATNGQLVRLAVAEDVVVNGLVAIPKGSLAVGKVTHLQRGVAGKRDGSIRITPLTLISGNGTRHKLWESMYGEDDCANAGPCWLLWTLSAPIGLIGMAINLPDYLDRDHPQGKDQSIEVCSSLSGYVAKKIAIQTIDLRAANSAHSDGDAPIPCGLAAAASATSGSAE